MAGKVQKTQQQICQEFLANPQRNPETGRPIEYGKGKYLELVKMCGNPTGVPPVSGVKGKVSPQTVMGLPLQAPTMGGPFVSFQQPPASLPGLQPFQLPSTVPGQMGLPPLGQMGLPPLGPIGLPPPGPIGLPSGPITTLPTWTGQPQPQMYQPQIYAPTPGFITGIQMGAPVSVQTQPKAPAIKALVGEMKAIAIKPEQAEGLKTIPIGPSILVVFHHPKRTDLYVVERIAENQELINDLSTINGLSSDNPNLTDDQSQTFETIESDLSEYFVGKSIGPLNNTNITNVVTLSTGEEEEEEEGVLSGGETSGEEDEEEEEEEEEED